MYQLSCRGGGGAGEPPLLFPDGIGGGASLPPLLSAGGGNIPPPFLKFGNCLCCGLLKFLRL